MTGADTVSARGADELPDEVLLERYMARREEAAFTALVRRYSPLVLSVCRRVLHHEQDAEDAFQAVFCILARKADLIRKRGAVGAWLHAVAYRVAYKARARRGRQPVSQSDLPDIPAAEGSPEWAWKELRTVLDAEVSRLPMKCRQAVILCYLEGRTNEQAAAQLGCPVGTVVSRLAQARQRLRARLTRRGLALSAATLAAVLSRHAAATAVQAGLAEMAVQTSLRYAAGQPIGTGVATLADGFLKTLLRTRLTAAVSLVSALAVVTAVPCLFWYRPWGAGAGNIPSPAARVAATPESEREKFQGGWQVLATRKAAGPDAVQAKGFRFTGDDWAVLFGEGFWTPPIPFKLDPSQEPKAIDCIMAPGMTALGIYRFDGDSLTLCLNWVAVENGGKRPTAFRPQPDDPKVIVYELKRESTGPAGP
jgi:RNA polymerase sigma factor (sigma-70 family)